VEYWAAHGNTGAVLVPIASTSSDTWAVSFLTSASSSRATFTVPTVKNPVPTNQPTQGSTGNTDSGGSTGSTGGGTSGGAPLSGGTATAPGSIGSAPSVAPQPGAAPSTANQTSPASDNSRTWWPWILLGSIMLAGAAVGVAQRDKLIPLVQRIGPPSIVALRAHPRAYTVAGVALSWGLLFTGYSIVVQPQRHDNQQNAANGSSVPGVGAGGQTTGPGATTGAAAAGAGSAGGNGASGTNGSGGSGTNGGDPSLNEFSGPGVWRTISGVQVFFPAKGGPPVAKLYSGKDDTIGITSNKVNLCAHAATTYGPAFNIEASDLNVYWQWRNAHGGVYGRQVNATYKNDDYKPDKAVQAAQSCKDDKTFVLLGGIGFDQIPAVRQWAEQNHELYLHHIAVGAGSEGKRYSFTSLPTVEDMGKFFAQLAISKFRGKKLGILYRQSPNWEPAVKVFRTMVKNAGMQIVGDYAVQKDQANYTQELAQLNGKADVVLAWENALASVEMIKQAQGLRYHPTWLLFPFNLQTNTLRETADDQELYGVAAWNAYDPGYYGGGFSSYAKEIKEFEAMYRTYDPGADLSGPGGDLLFLNWEGQKSIDGMLQICGAQCTRNKIAGIMLAGYRGGAKPACPVDFSRGDHHHGGYLVNVFHAGRDPNGRINFMPIQRCTSQVG
jgi:ABC-type branched-subunit amino acid transport system substrate-binding protein